MLMNHVTIRPTSAGSGVISPVYTITEYLSYDI